MNSTFQDENVSRICTEGGKWFTQNGKEWANYTNCTNTTNVKIYQTNNSFADIPSGTDEVRGEKIKSIIKSYQLKIVFIFSGSYSSCRNVGKSRIRCIFCISYYSLFNNVFHQVIFLPKFIYQIHNWH